MDCRNFALPIRIAPNSVAHVKVFNKKHFSNAKSLIYDIRNDGNKDLLWPSLKAIRSVTFNPGIFAYQCDVVNHAQTNLIDVAIRLSINFNRGDTLTSLAVISPLDAGATFSLYLVNECPVTVGVIAPSQATVQVFGEDTRRVVPLHWPHRNPVEQIMMLLPSKVSWTGAACE